MATVVFRDSLLEAIPRLRAYARSLTHDMVRADDIVQTTMVKALAHSEIFDLNSNMVAWLCTILRNEFYSEYRKRLHEVEDQDGRYALSVQHLPSQEWHIYALDVRAALTRLAPDQSEALMMIVSGMSYEEVSGICGCAVGTIKSRVNRARVMLATLLREDPQNASEVQPRRPRSRAGPLSVPTHKPDTTERLMHRRAP